MCKVWVAMSAAMESGWAGRVDTKSAKVRAGTAMAPSSSTLAPTEQVMAISRFVELRRRRPSSVDTSTLLRMGSDIRELTARPAMLSPRARFSCRHETLIQVLRNDWLAVGVGAGGRPSGGEPGPVRHARVAMH